MFAEIYNLKRRTGGEPPNQAYHDFLQMWERRSMLPPQSTVWCIRENKIR